MTAALARQQQAMVRALWSPRLADATRALSAHVDPAWPQPFWERGLQAYRSHGLALAARALAGTYPVLRMLLGAESFDALAWRHWQRQPPACGDMAQWGGALAHEIAGLPQLASEEPYLPDLARLEWLVHLASTAADAPPDMASFALLATCEPEAVALVSAPGLACVTSAFPVASIVAAHLEGEPSLEEAGLRLRHSQAEAAVVWRQGFRPQRRHALPGEPELIAGLQDKRSLAASLAAAPELDFQAWLPLAVRTGLVIGVQPC
jgi:hypothetical protein